MEHTFDYSKLPHNHVLCLDMKSFFASVECVRRGMDPMTTLLAVIGDKTLSGSIVLAASPMMKARYGINTGSRLSDIPKDKHIHVVEARMEDYLRTSVKITELLNTFVSTEAIHPYSVDEAWICTDGSEKLFGDRWEIAVKIRKKIYEQYGLPTCIGIGPNKFLAKVILDVESKTKGIAECRYEDVPEKLWPQPLKHIWGIGARMEENLYQMGLSTLYDLAHYPLGKLKHKFGIMGEQLYYHAHGIDLSPVTGYRPDPDSSKSFGQGVTLPRHFKGSEVPAAILDIAEEICRRARKAQMCGRTVHLSIRYSKGHGPGGFSKSISTEAPTNVTLDVYQLCLALFEKYYNGRPVKAIYMSLGNLCRDSGIQLSLFEDNVRRKKIGAVMDEIRDKHGYTALLRASSYTSGGVAKDRSTRIGGHKK